MSAVDSLIRGLKEHLGWAMMPNVKARRFIVNTGASTQTITVSGYGIMMDFNSWLENTNAPSITVNATFNGGSYTYNRQSCQVRIFPSVVSPSCTLFNNDPILFKTTLTLDTAYSANHYTSVLILEITP